MCVLLWFFELPTTFKCPTHATHSEWPSYAREQGPWLHWAGPHMAQRGPLMLSHLHSTLSDPTVPGSRKLEVTRAPNSKARAGTLPPVVMKQEPAFLMSRGLDENSCGRRSYWMADHFHVLLLNSSRHKAQVSQGCGSSPKFHLCQIEHRRIAQDSSQPFPESYVQQQPQPRRVGRAQVTG